MRVGLTGGVASGKSTVGRILTELGAVVIDADALARDVVAPGTEGLALVVAQFGPDVVASDGSLDRAALGAHIFADVAARRRLEAIIHPRVRALAAQIEARAPSGSLVVHDIPLLIETGQQDTFDAVIVVDVPTEVQRQRLQDLRGMSAAAAEARLAAQATRAERLALATYVIDNVGTFEDLRQQVTEVFQVLRGRPEGPP
jgi:dephospho-CoA kinase